MRGQTYNIAGGPSWRMMSSQYIRGIYGALGVEVEPSFSEDYTEAKKLKERAPRRSMVVT